MSRGGLRRQGGDMTAKRLYPLLACAAIAYAVAALVVGQLDAQDLLNTGVGDGVAMAVLGIGSVALLGGLRVAGAPVRGTPERLMLVWAAAIGLSGLAPVPLEIVAFGSLAGAAALLVPRLRADEAWRGIARTVEWLALAGGLGVLAFTYVALPGQGVLIGLVERALLVADVALLAVLAGWLTRIVWAKAVNFPTYHRFIASGS